MKVACIAYAVKPKNINELFCSSLGSKKFISASIFAQPNEQFHPLYVLPTNKLSHQLTLKKTRLNKRYEYAHVKYSHVEVQIYNRFRVFCN